MGTDKPQDPTKASRATTSRKTQQKQVVQRRAVRPNKSKSCNDEPQDAPKKPQTTNESGTDKPSQAKPQMPLSLALSVTTGSRVLAEGRLHRSRREFPIPAVAGGGDPFQNSVPFASVRQGITQYSKGKEGVQREKTVGFLPLVGVRTRREQRSRRFSVVVSRKRGSKKGEQRGGKPSPSSRN